MLPTKDAKWDQMLTSLFRDLRENKVGARFTNLLLLSITADIINNYLDIQFNKLHSIGRIGFHILHVLVINQGSLSQTDISREVARSKHTISRAIDSLEKKGLVKRKSVTGDRRLNMVFVTEKGIQLVSDSLSDRVEMSTTALDCLDDNELRILKKFMLKLKYHFATLLSKLAIEDKKINKKQ